MFSTLNKIQGVLLTQLDVNDEVDEKQVMELLPLLQKVTHKELSFAAVRGQQITALVNRLRKRITNDSLAKQMKNVVRSWLSIMNPSNNGTSGSPSAVAAQGACPATPRPSTGRSPAPTQSASPCYAAQSDPATWQSCATGQGPAPTPSQPSHASLSTSQGCVAATSQSSSTALNYPATSPSPSTGRGRGRGQRRGRVSATSVSLSTGWGRAFTSLSPYEAMNVPSISPSPSTGRGQGQGKARGRGRGRGGASATAPSFSSGHQNTKTLGKQDSMRLSSQFMMNQGVFAAHSVLHGRSMSPSLRNENFLERTVGGTDTGRLDCDRSEANAASRKCARSNTSPLPGIRKRARTDNCSAATGDNHTVRPHPHILLCNDASSGDNRSISLGPRPQTVKTTREMVQGMKKSNCLHLEDSSIQRLFSTSSTAENSSMHTVPSTSSSAENSRVHTVPSTSSSAENSRVHTVPSTSSSAENSRVHTVPSSQTDTSQPLFGNAQWKTPDSVPSTSKLRDHTNSVPKDKKKPTTSPPSTSQPNQRPIEEVLDEIYAQLPPINYEAAHQYQLEQIRIDEEITSKFEDRQKQEGLLNDGALECYRKNQWPGVNGVNDINGKWTSFDQMETAIL